MITGDRKKVLFWQSEGIFIPTCHHDNQTLFCWLPSCPWLWAIPWPQYALLRNSANSATCPGKSFLGSGCEWWFIKLQPKWFTGTGKLRLLHERKRKWLQGQEQKCWVKSIKSLTWAQWSCLFLTIIKSCVCTDSFLHFASPLFVWFLFHFFYWSIVDLQCCVDFCCTTKRFSYTSTYIVFHILFHDGLSQDTKYSFLRYIVGACCLSIQYIIACICYPETPVPSRTTPPPLWQPPICSLCLWICFCFMDRFICVIFYIPHISNIIGCLSFSVWLTSLSTIVSRSIHPSMLLPTAWFPSFLSVHYF